MSNTFGILVSFMWIVISTIILNKKERQYKEIRAEYYELGVRHGIRSGIEDYIPSTDTTPKSLCNCILVTKGYRNKKTGEFLGMGNVWEEINLDSIQPTSPKQ